MAADLDGFLNVLKPPGMTSHDVVRAVRRLGVRRAGHTGTLDPGASGVLVVACGRATRLAEYVTDRPKRYRAEIRFGFATDTQDAQGRVTTSAPPPAWPSRETVVRALDAFRGRILQRPPQTSAVKVCGEPLYRRARRGEAVTVAPRPVTIYRLELLDWSDEPDGPRAILDVECSRGTYVRTLAHDLGARVACPAHLSFLVRSAVGPFGVDTATTLEELAAAAAAGRLGAALAPPAAAVEHLPGVRILPAWVTALARGRVVPPEGWVGDLPARGAPELACFTPAGRLVALARRRAGGIQARLVLEPAPGPEAGAGRAGAGGGGGVGAEGRRDG